MPATLAGRTHAGRRHGVCVIPPADGVRRVKVLLAGNDPERTATLGQIVETDPALSVLRPRDGQALGDAIAELAPDVVLVEVIRPDRDALNGIWQANALYPRPLVLFVHEDDPGFMEEAIGAGVSSYNLLGPTPPDVKPILRAAVALFRRHQHAQDGLRQAENRLHERDLIDRAKAILIRGRRMGEPEAYRWLRRQAMRQGRRIAEVAQALIRETEGSS